MPPEFAGKGPPRAWCKSRKASPGRNETPGQPGETEAAAAATPASMRPVGFAYLRGTRPARLLKTRRFLMPSLPRRLRPEAAAASRGRPGIQLTTAAARDLSRWQQSRKFPPPAVASPLCACSTRRQRRRQTKRGSHLLTKREMAAADVPS
uniref:Uncharacterized protein n=1 Tax=Sphaerodactylus townsendi TaxID=933632 RepID=A0ACB8F9V1_9SAUR